SLPLVQSISLIPSLVSFAVQHRLTLESITTLNLQSLSSKLWERERSKAANAATFSFRIVPNESRGKLAHSSLNLWEKKGTKPSSPGDGTTTARSSCFPQKERVIQSKKPFLNSFALPTRCNA